MAKRSNAHTKAQKAGRVRDYETCQACGSTKKVQGHHIFDHQYSGAPSTDTLKFEVMKKVGDTIGNVQAYKL